MAIQSPEAGSMPVPALTAGLVEATLAEVRGVNFEGVFRPEELAIMRDRNQPLFDMHTNRLEHTLRHEGIGAATQVSAGYLVGHRILRQALGDQRLPWHTPDELERYIWHADRVSGTILEDFIHYYGDYPEFVTALDESFTNSCTRYGAHLLLVLGREWDREIPRELFIPGSPGRHGSGRSGYVRARHGQAMTRF